MREILFRGKREYGGNWVIGSLISWPDGDAEILYPHPYSKDEMSKVLVYPETVGQFTGVYDSTKWEDLTDAEKLDFYHQHYIGEDGMSVRFQHIDDVKFLWEGKKIFEGDILHVLGNQQVEDWKNVNYIGSVAFLDAGFCVIDGTVEDHAFRRYQLPRLDFDLEVIGNIHDNPELLEEGDS